MVGGERAEAGWVGDVCLGSEFVSKLERVDITSRCTTSPSRSRRRVPKIMSAKTVE